MQYLYTTKILIIYVYMYVIQLHMYMSPFVMEKYVSAA